MGGEIYNYDIENIITPLKIMKFEQILKEVGYPSDDAKFLVEGFSTGFDIGYTGPKMRQSTSQNIPFTVGTKQDLWGQDDKGSSARQGSRTLHIHTF